MGVLLISNIRNQDKEFFLLTAYKESQLYTYTDKKLQLCWDEQKIQYLIDIKNQFYDMDGFTVSFSQPESHEILLLDSAGNVLKQQWSEAGTHTFSLPEKTEFILVSAAIDEADKLDLKGRLSEKGKSEKSKKRNPFSGKKFSLIGDSLSSYEGYIPDGFPFQYPSGDVQLSDMWWYRLARNLDMEICKINACSGSGVTDQTEYANEPEMVASMGRGKELEGRGYKPDVIFVLIGGNDVISKVPRKDISEGYRTMMEDITNTYPEAEIYLCTYYPCYINMVDTSGWLNEEIRKISVEYKTGLIDLENCGITLENQEEYLLDGLHPNEKGLHLLSAWMTEELLRPNP